MYLPNKAYRIGTRSLKWTDETIIYSAAVGYRRGLPVKAYYQKKASSADTAEED